MGTWTSRGCIDLMASGWRRHRDSKMPLSRSERNRGSSGGEHLLEVDGERKSKMF